MRLAAVQTNDPRVRRAVDEAFVFGFRRILWLAVVFSLVSGVCAQFVTAEKRETNLEGAGAPEQTA